MPAYVSECLYMCVFERLYVFVCSYVYECAFIHVCVIFTDFVYPAVYLFTRWIIYTGIENLSCLSWTLCQGKPTLSDGSLWHWGHCDTGYSAGHVIARRDDVRYWILLASAVRDVSETRDRPTSYQCQTSCGMCQIDTAILSPPVLLPVCMSVKYVKSILHREHTN